MKVLPFSQQCLIISQGYEAEAHEQRFLGKDLPVGEGKKLYGDKARMLELHKYAFRQAYELALRCEMVDDG